MLAGVLFLIGLLAFIAIAMLLAVNISAPPRFNDGKAVYLLQRLSPGDLGLQFENVRFAIRDQTTGNKISLTGWWIPHPQNSSQTMILIHDYAEAKVVSISLAPLFTSLGMNVLAIDLRAHAESGGDHCTGGFFEADDLSQVIDQLLNDRPKEATRIFLFGTQFGAIVAAAIAARRDDLAGVILERAPTDFRRFIAARAKQIGWPTGPVLGLALHLSKWISHGKYQDVQLANLLKSTKCDVLQFENYQAEEPRLRKFLGVD